MSAKVKLLPLGSAVAVTDIEGTFIIIARGFQKTGDGFLAGYKGVPHPQGAGTGAKEIVLSQSQIEEVIHLGYESPDDASFAKKQLENAKTPTQKPAPVKEPDLTVDLASPAPAASHAPHKTVEEVVPVSVALNSLDPFSELRNKGKRA